MSAPLLEVRKFAKSFPGVRALRGVSLTLARGEVLAVIGENGAGKSTLMKILAGVQRQDSGELLLDGEHVEIHSVHDALVRGIALIHQELNLAENLDVAANIFLGREPHRAGLMDLRRMRREAGKFLEAVGLDVDPSAVVRTLPIGKQQLVEIAKALSTNARVLIMDEPTSSLSNHEAENLFKVIADLGERGVSVIYISHRLGEVKRIAGRVTVLRDGENAGELLREEIDHARMVKLMVGRDISQFYVRVPHTPGAVALDVRALRTDAHPRHAVTLSVRAGEIVGIAGLVGSGRTELLETIFGVRPALGGSIRVGEMETVPQSPLDAIAAGLALVPEERKRQGLVAGMSVRENVSLASLRRDQFHGLLNRKREAEMSAKMCADLRIKTPHDAQAAQFLSGGNQQKVVLGKWLALEPRVLLLDEPTRGIDIGAKQEIYRLMEELAARGVAILFVSSEMEEILGMSDRALVMHDGKIAGELSRAQLSEEAVMHLATGGASS